MTRLDMANPLFGVTDDIGDTFRVGARQYVIISRASHTSPRKYKFSTKIRDNLIVPEQFKVGIRHTLAGN